MWFQRLVEKNVIEQCLNVYKTGVVQHHRLKTFHNKEKYNTDFAYPRVHAMVFDPSDGLLQKLQVDFKASIAELQDVYDLYKDGGALSRHFRAIFVAIFEPLSSPFSGDIMWGAFGAKCLSVFLSVRC